MHLLRVIVALSLILLSQLALANAQDKKPKVLLIQSSHTAQAKISMLESAAEGVSFELISPKTKGLDDAAFEELWQSADLLLLDGINPALFKFMFYKRAPLVKKYPNIKVIGIGDVPNSPLNNGASKEQVRLLNDYFLNGGKRNYSNMMRYIDANIFGAQAGKIADPIKVPKSGLYHPDLDGLLSDNETEFFNWLDEKPGAAIAIAMHRSVVDYEQTQVVDAMIRGIESKGMKAFGFFHEGEDLPLDYVDLLIDDKEQTRVSAIIYYRALHYIEKRKAEFARLNVPVLHALNYQDGDEKHFDENHTGISANMTPFFLVMPESAGVIDSIVLTAKDEAGNKVVMAKQMTALIERAVNHAALSAMPNQGKKLAAFIWNYPPGEKNIGAAFLDVPGSLENIAKTLKAEGYQVSEKDEAYFIEGAGKLLRLFYRDEDPLSYIEDGIADLLPLASYEEWFAELPAAEQAQINERWGQPADHFMVAEHEGVKGFVIPRLDLGNLIVLPQGSRSNDIGDKSGLYHSMKTPVNHYYLALYLYARHTFKANALLHIGTHGSQEWLTGKERGLSVHDAPNLNVGNLPVFYPYIIDNVGEAMQAKRRGRATMISHLTPGFAKAGLYREIAELADLLANYSQLDEGQTKEETKANILALVESNNIAKDLKLSEEDLNNAFDDQIAAIQDHLTKLSKLAQPLGVHTFGVLPEQAHLISTILQMLGKEFDQLAAEYESSQGWSVAAAEQFDENGSVRLEAITGFQILSRILLDGQNLDLPKAFEPFISDAKTHWKNFHDIAELESLVNALEGQYIPVGNGGDPIRNPKAVPTGKNLIGFNPAKVPSKEAYESGVKVIEQTIADYRNKHGRYPDKLAFSLWSLETMRHHGALEAQVLHAMGVKPVWNRQGNITGTEIIPYAELGRPRVDVVISATGLYRDAFPNVMLWMADAIDKVAKLKEEGNSIYKNAQALKSELLEAGKDEAEADYLSSIRIFSNESGNYGTGLAAGSLASDTWESDSKLADLYLKRMGYMFGKDESRWSDSVDSDIYSKVLSGTDAVVFSRSSNLYALLTNDDPFQYFGGIALAVRNIDGATPDMYVSNLRRKDDVRSESMEDFLNQELRSRYFHPRWIQAMQDEGYAGATAILDRMNNFWGWEVMTPENIRDDQWQEFFEIYVDDKYDMDMREFFENANPEALAHMLQLMLEANRKEYWKADAATLEQMIKTYEELATAHDIYTDNEKFVEYVNQQAVGFGLAPLPVSVNPAVAPPQPTVSGQKLEKQESQSSEMDNSKIYWIAFGAFLLFVLGMFYELFARPARQNITM
ncbi:MAG: cobaltochelatase subunit CobN [Cellvibrionaceae bacterium]|nr:cobaltochelatase subunit CobN [Cellvibrionaceae bacterium]